MIDLAEFPVQRKSTFKGSWLLTTSITPSLAALRQRCRNEWLANLALATATVLHEKREKVSRSL
jgi:hypothetical protein